MVVHVFVIFPKTFKKKSFGNTIRVSNRLDSDQDRQNPDLGPNYLQILSADDKSR